MNRTFKLPNRTLDDNSPAFIIAEIGINHQGNIDIAKKLILQAKETAYFSTQTSLCI